MTQDELKSHAASAQNRLSELEKFLDVPGRQQRHDEVEKLMAEPNFWNDRERAQELIAELRACRNVIGPFKQVGRRVGDFAALVELAAEAEDAETLAEAGREWAALAPELERLELVSFLGGKCDANNAFFTIHAGAGGTESCDWASMLLRMYRRWFERRGYQDEILDYSPGEEAGLKSVTLQVTGEFAYGYLKAERGVHRLVRISPFDSNARRHTSFASVDAIPEISDDIDVAIEEKDLRIDTYRASGAGGQHVNKTDSAIRITHLPSGIIVSCQSERSQHKNRATAMKMLRARLYAIEEEARRQETEAMRGEKTEMGWGNQIRSYVLHPYQMVKDLRTDVETGNTAAVLDGELDRFVEAWLRQGGNRNVRKAKP